VVLHAYRLLARRMAEEEMDYPLHLGVTEAGDGEDGRVKSAIGIGALLDEGIGDTVRVSLTEDPVREIPVARALVEPYNRLTWRAPDRPATVVEVRDPFSYERRATHEVALGPHRAGGGNAVLVEVPLWAVPQDADTLQREWEEQTGAGVAADRRAEVLSVAVRRVEDIAALARLRPTGRDAEDKVALSVRLDAHALSVSGAGTPGDWFAVIDRLHVVAREPGDASLVDALGPWLEAARNASGAVLLEAGSAGADPSGAVDLAVRAAAAQPAVAPRALLLGLTPLAGTSPLLAYRRLAARLAAEGHRTPLVLIDDAARRDGEPLLASSTALGGLLCDGIGDAIHVVAESPTASRRLAFGILQASRVRTTRTEFVSCPSCGRTLFDLEETTARIKRRTGHLKGLKIAVMGCIVNGPGEMADADFGYVGWGEGRIALFVGKKLVAKNVPTEEADQRLVELIREHGRWTEPA
jgi:(E)-4-hydroxy-3-methylbut-2-enyl-diphosphate synthase